jgi:hypothetical protein
LDLRDHRNVQEIPRRNLNFKVASRLIPFPVIYEYLEYKNYLQLNSLAANQEEGFPGENYPDKEMTPVKALVQRGADIHFSMGGQR